MSFGEKKLSNSHVQELLRAEQFKYEISLSEQKERIFELVEENKKLKKEILNYKTKDEQVGKALICAVGRAKEIEDNARTKYVNGINRLKIFESKFANYYKMIMQSYPADQTLMQAEEFIKQLDEVLDVDNMSSVDNLKKMFTSKNSLGQSGNFGAATSESGFDFSEALNPSKDLEDICRELGLMK